MTPKLQHNGDMQSFQILFIVQFQFGVQQQFGVLVLYGWRNNNKELGKQNREQIDMHCRW